MNREHDKLKLDSTPLRLEDASKEALAMAKKDTVLRKWLVKWTAFDETVTDVSSTGMKIPDLAILT